VTAAASGPVSLERMASRVRMAWPERMALRMHNRADSEDPRLPHRVKGGLHFHFAHREDPCCHRARS
jgi:hypothetical protein